MISLGISGSIIAPTQPPDRASRGAAAQCTPWNLRTAWSPFRDVADLDGAREFCRKWSDWSGGKAAFFLVFDATGGRTQGMVTLHHVDPRDQSAEIGFITAPWARGHGVATTAVGPVLQWAFDSLDLVRIVLLHAVGNAPSCRVADRLGFRLEGETRSSHRYGDGELHNEHLHSRLVTD